MRASKEPLREPRLLPFLPVKVCFIGFYKEIYIGEKSEIAHRERATNKKKKEKLNE